MDGEERSEPHVATPLLFGAAVEKARVAICLTDATRPDNPLAYVNPAFEALTGYSRAEAVGRNCRFLQGAGTDPSTVERLRAAIDAAEPIQVEILNYRRDGSPFWNALHVAPITDADGTVRQFYASQMDVSDAVAEREGAAATSMIAREMRHRAANLYSVFGALVSLSMPPQAEPETAAFVATLSARIQAMGRADAMAAGAANTVGLSDLVGGVLAPFETPDRVRLDGPPMGVPGRLAGPLALILHEFAVNAAMHGALRGAGAGTLAVSWAPCAKTAGQLVLRWVENDPGAASGAEPAAARGTGAQITDGVIASLGGKIERDWGPSGPSATLRVPLG